MCLNQSKIKKTTKAKSAPSGATRKIKTSRSPSPTARRRVTTGSPKLKRKGSTKKGRKSAKSSKPPEPVVDIKSPAAMLNAYYICHSAAEFLNCRGFEWPGASKKKKKKGKSKK